MPSNFADAAGEAQRGQVDCCRHTADRGRADFPMPVWLSPASVPCSLTTPLVPIPSGSWVESRPPGLLLLYYGLRGSVYASHVTLGHEHREYYSHCPRYTGNF